MLVPTVEYADQLQDDLDSAYDETDAYVSCVWKGRIGLSVAQPELCDIFVVQR